MNARGKFGEHERSVRVGRGAAESNSSFLTALKGGGGGKSDIPESFASNYIINWPRSHDLIISTWTRSKNKRGKLQCSKSSMLYLYCIDPDFVSELTVPSLPFLKLKCLFGHVSFPGFLSERRLVVFPECERVIEKVRNIPSPCVIEVLSSVEFQVRIQKCIDQFGFCHRNSW